MNSWPVRLLALTLVAGTLGCGTLMARDITRETTSTAINTTLRSLNERENQQIIARLLASPEVHAAARELAADIADGSLGLLSEPERMARIEAITARYISSLTRAAVRGMAEGIRRDMAPVMADVMRQTVASALREAMSDGYQRDLERVAAGVTRATVEAASREMAQGMARDLGPALQRSVESPETQRALGVAARTLSREVVFGSNEALAQIQRAQERSGRPSFLSGLATLTDRGARIAQWIGIALVTLCVVLALWVARLVLRTRRAQAESERNAAAVKLLAEAIRASEGKPWGDELLQALHGRLRRDSVADVLNDMVASAKPRVKASVDDPPVPPGRRVSHA